MQYTATADIDSKATITLTLSNRGPNAFQPEKYPEKIVIERVIERNGGGGYKFQADRDGPILERKRSELQAILSHFALNMDSPLTLLTQDNAKSFLASSDPRSLYDVCTVPIPTDSSSS